MKNKAIFVVMALSVPIVASAHTNEGVFGPVIPLRGSLTNMLNTVVKGSGSPVWILDGATYKDKDTGAVIERMLHIVLDPYDSGDGYCRTYEIDVTSPNELFSVSTMRLPRSYEVISTLFMALKNKDVACNSLDFKTAYFSVNKNLTGDDMNRYITLLDRVIDDWYGKKPKPRCGIAVDDLTNVKLYHVGNQTMIDYNLMPANCGVGMEFEVEVTPTTKTLKYSGFQTLKEPF